MLFWKKNCTSPNTIGSGAGIADDHDQPGMLIWIDQIEFSQDGLIPILKGRQTSKKYHVTTIFVDNFSKFTYVHFSENTTANESVKAKSEFEQYAAAFGVNIQKYHAKMVP